jgi:hypothetical protein
MNTNTLEANFEEKIFYTHLKLKFTNMYSTKLQHSMKFLLVKVSPNIFTITITLIITTVTAWEIDRYPKIHSFVHIHGTTFSFHCSIYLIMLSQLHATQLSGWITRCWTCQTANSTDYSCSLAILPKRKVTSPCQTYILKHQPFSETYLYLLPVFHKLHITPTIYWLQQTIIINAECCTSLHVCTSAHTHNKRRQAMYA